MMDQQLARKNMLWGWLLLLLFLVLIGGTVAVAYIYDAVLP
jgi:hypothetical protein